LNGRHPRDAGGAHHPFTVGAHKVEMGVDICVYSLLVIAGCSTPYL